MSEGKKEILLGDCLELMKDIPNGSIDAIITDPPYTDGNINVLDGHKIQTMFSIESVMNEFYRVLKKDSFMAFFGQMPTILEWHNQAIKVSQRTKAALSAKKARVGKIHSEKGNKGAANLIASDANNGRG